jgi:hypothetical protein
MRKESTNHRNGFLMEKPCLLLTQCTKNLEFAIGKKPLVSMRLMNTRRQSNWEREKIIITWRIVSIDDFLCYENRISFLRWDYPKKPKWHIYQVYEIHMKFSPSQGIFDYNSIRKLNALCSLWQWNQAPRVTVSSYFINNIETFVNNDSSKNTIAKDNSTYSRSFKT